MNDSRLVIAALTTLTLTACSGPQTKPTPDDATADAITPSDDTTTEDVVRGDSPTVAAAMMKGPFASLEAFAQAEGAEVLRVDPGATVTEGTWATEGGVLTLGADTRHVLLGGKLGALYVLESGGAFTIDTSNTTPEQLEGTAIIREASLPPGYVLFEHIVDYVDATQSGEAHDVLGFSHLCRPHDGGMACARFTTKMGAYLVTGEQPPEYEMPNAVIKDADGVAHTLELFYMNGGPGMDAPGFYQITLP